MMKFTHIADIPPRENNPRNSEGDFITLPDGRIMYAYSGYSGDSWHDCASCSVCAVFSEDGGKSFDTGAPVTLVSPERFGVKNIMSVSLRSLPDGDIGLFFIVKHEGENFTSEYVLIRSRDGIHYDGEPVRCLPDVFPGYYVVNNSRVEITPDGLIIIPAGIHRAGMRNGEFVFEQYAQTVFFISSDGGRTFTRAPEILSMPCPTRKSGLQEPGVITLPDGTLYAYFRTDASRQYQSFSSDKGIHWTTPEPSRFTSPLSPMKIAKNPYSGKYYAIYNPIPTYDGRDCPGYTMGRTPLCISESADGINFSDIEYIETDPDCGYCYPAIYFLSDKKALVSYCGGGHGTVCLCKTTITAIELN